MLPTSVDPRLLMRPGSIRRPATSADDQSPITTGRAREWQRKWQRLIDHTLIDWGWNQAIIEDEGIAAPTRGTVSAAAQFAQDLMRSGEFPPPTRVVPDPNGGIVFEHEANGVLEYFRISPDIGYEYCRLQKGHLVERRVWQSEID
jgi:hypothetical protein